MYKMSKQRRRRKFAMVCFTEVFNLQEAVGFDEGEMAELCGLQRAQYRRYKSQGVLPIERFAFAKNGIKVALMEEIFKIQEKIKALD